MPAFAGTALSAAIFFAVKPAKKDFRYNRLRAHGKPYAIPAVSFVPAATKSFTFEVDWNPEEWWCEIGASPDSSLWPDYINIDYEPGQTIRFRYSDGDLTQVN